MSTSSTDLVGSWFPTGYYGHVRNKPRSDFVCEYRQLAKPQPPRKFISRSLQQDTRYSFSLHDNRNVFSGSAVSFGKGMGRRRNPDKSGTFNPDFYAWMPLQNEITRSLPHISTYQQNYTHNGVKQLLVKPPETSFGDKPITTYHYQFGETGPNIQLIRHIARPTMQLTTFSREHAGRRLAPHHRETVASCLNWHRSKTPTPSMTGCRASIDLVNMPHVPTPPQSGCPQQAHYQMKIPETVENRMFLPQSCPACCHTDTLQSVSAGTPAVDAPQEPLAA